MLKKIKLNDKEITFVLKSNPLAKRIRIIINQNGRVVLTKPKRVNDTIAIKFLESQADFIFERLKELNLRNKKLFGLSDAFGLVNEGSSKHNYQEHKLRAANFIKERLEYFNQFYQFKFGRISIRNQNTRWGSCSRQGNLNFNYRLLFLPKELADYVIVHELCHLKELNHSAAFWDLVRQTITNHKQKRQKLKGFL